MSDTPSLGERVEVAGFEPTTTCTPSKCATGLRYTSIDLRKVVGEEGFEPSNAGIRTQCLTRLGDSPTDRMKVKWLPKWDSNPRPPD